MNTSILIDYYQRMVWPFYSKFVKSPKRCKKCILSEHYTKIKNGICKYCKDFKEETEVKNNFTLKNLKDIVYDKAFYNPIDATILVSGGKDSAFIVNEVKRIFPDIKFMCIFVDNGFTSKVAFKNIQRLAKIENVELLIVNSYKDKFKETFRKVFLSLNGDGSYGTIDYADGSLIFKIGETITRSLKIPMIFSGLSWVQLQKILNINTFFEEKNNLLHVYPLAVFKEGEEEIKQKVIERKLILKGNENPIVTNNELIPTMVALDIKNLGYCSFEPEFAQLVREGKANRNEWISTMNMITHFTKMGFFDKEIERTLNRLDLTTKDVIK